MNELKFVSELQQELLKLIPIEKTRSEILEKKFRLEFNYNTNHIEGNTITYSETELLLIFDNTQGNHTLREFEEMKGSDVAYQLTKDLAADLERPLLESDIKHLNEILLVRPFWKEAITEDGQATRRLIKVGDYKDYPNSVRLQNGEIFHYSTPIETPALMAELIQWFRNEEEKKETNPVALAALLHYKFVSIHPFDDGNGRLSRLLMNYVLFKNNLPPVIIKSEHKKLYLAALNKADSGDVNSFIKFIAQQLIWSLELSIKAAKGQSIDEPGDLTKKIKQLKSKLKIGIDKITVVKSDDTVWDIFQNSLIPLFHTVSEVFSEIDSMFKSSSEYLVIGSKPLGNNLSVSIDKFRSYLQSNHFSIIEYRHEFNDFRSSEKNKDFISKFRIDLHHHVYEIIINDKVECSKLYSEHLNESDIELITEQLGMKLIKEIEDLVED